MKNEKLTTERISINNQTVHKGIEDIVNPNKDSHLFTKDEGQERPVIIGRVPGIGRIELLKSRPNGDERSVITISVERNRDGYHNITINMDFSLPLGVVNISKEDGR